MPPAPVRPRELLVRAPRAELAGRELGVVARRCSTSAKRVTTGRIAMFCSLVQIGQFCSSRLWRQNDGIADSEHYMNAAVRCGRVRSPKKRPGGPDPSGPPGEPGKWGRSSLTDRGEFPRPKLCSNTTAPKKFCSTPYDRAAATLAPQSSHGEIPALSRTSHSTQVPRVAGPVKNWSPGRTEPA